ncbi:MAG: phenylpyruvate tautomerase MIF-related protein [Candidatus Omnitrophica bacterium]|nr:phenylpyruvate tautomerase MIF-related protein [Candidatus Omnitrophota bacterium]
MPLLKLYLPAMPAEEKGRELLAALSAIVTECTGKPEQYVMTTLHPGSLMMSGQPGAAALAEIRSIGGLTPDVNRQISRKVCHLLEQSLGIPPNRVYLNFKELRAGDWGWNSNTFA